MRGKWIIAALVCLVQQEVAADGNYSIINHVNNHLNVIDIIIIFIFIIVCGDSMIYMDLCTQWSAMCPQSKFLQEKCPRTCGTCAPGNLLYNVLLPFAPAGYLLLKSIKP